LAASAELTGDIVPQLGDLALEDTDAVGERVHAVGERVNPCRERIHAVREPIQSIEELEVLLVLELEVAVRARKARRHRFAERRHRLVERRKRGAGLVVHDLTIAFVQCDSMADRVIVRAVRDHVYNWPGANSL
jgi:hypothetical protein